MPWVVADVDEHMKDLSAGEKVTWVEVANGALATCTKTGGEECDASAIKQANAVIGKLREAHVSIEVDDYTEDGTKATGDPSQGTESFVEEGVLLEVDDG